MIILQERFQVKIFWLLRIARVSVSDRHLLPLWLPIIHPRNSPGGVILRGEGRDTDRQGGDVPGVHKPLSKSLIPQGLFSQEPTGLFCFLIQAE